MPPKRVEILEVSSKALILIPLELPEI